MIFMAVLEMVFRNLHRNDKRLNINGEKLYHLSFEHDLVIFSENAQELELRLKQLAEENMKVELTMNPKKTKLTTNSNKTNIFIKLY